MSSEIIPAWIKWIAQDKNGAVWGFEAEPHQHEYGWYENEVGRYKLLLQANKSPEWENSLTAIKDVPNSRFANLIK